MVPPEDTTPLVALTTVAFGGFRGLVADALWLRAAAMQEEGEFFEMVQLSEWITQLEPRAPKVWSFQAWNLAYNISALFPSHEDRWRWVNHGMNLLKEEGLVHNPTSARLFWDIGWMYQHKIGMEFDRGHIHYKNRLAEQVNALLPGGLLLYEVLDTDQKQVIADELSMDPVRMQVLDETYGPLDWRLPETHSLYWATAGLDHRASAFERGTLTRMQRQSLSSLTRGGKRVEDPATGHYLLLPRPDLIPKVEALYFAYLHQDPWKRTAMTTTQKFVRESGSLYAEMNQITKALETYETLAVLHPKTTPGREAFQKYLHAVLSQPPSTLTRTQAMSRVVSMLILAEDPALSPLRARGRLQIARQTYLQYMDNRLNEEHLERTELPPFEVMQRMVQSQNLWASGLFPGL